MAATYRSSTIATGTTSVSPGLPALTAAADLMVALVAADQSADPTAPAGWTLVNKTLSGAFGVWWYTAPGNTAGPFTWTVAASVNISAVIVSVQGTSTLSVDASSGQANSSSLSCTAPNPVGTAGGCLVCGFAWSIAENSLTNDAGLTTAQQSLAAPAFITGYLNNAGASPGTHTATATNTAAVNIGVSVLVKDAALAVDNVSSLQGIAIGKGPINPGSQDVTVLYRHPEAIMMGGKPSAAVSPPAPILPPLVYRPVIALADDALGQARNGEATIMGGRSGLGVTPPPAVARVIVFQQTAEDPYSWQRQHGESRIMGGLPSAGVTPPASRTLRNPIVTLADDSLAMARPAESVIMGGMASAAVQPVPLRPLVQQSAAEDVLSWQRHAEMVPTISRATLPTTPSLPRVSVAMPPDDSQPSWPPPTSLVIGGMASKGVTPPTPRPMQVFAQIAEVPVEGRGTVSWVIPVHLRPAPTPTIVTVLAEDPTPQQIPPSAVVRGSFSVSVAPRALIVTPAEDMPVFQPVQPTRMGGQPVQPPGLPSAIRPVVTEDPTLLWQATTTYLAGGRPSVAITPPRPTQTLVQPAEDYAPLTPPAPVVSGGRPSAGVTPPRPSPLILSATEDVLFLARAPDGTILGHGSPQSAGPRPLLFVAAEDVLSPMKPIDTILFGPRGVIPVAGPRSVMVIIPEDAISLQRHPEGRAPTIPTVPSPGRPTPAQLTVYGIAPADDTAALWSGGTAWISGPWPTAIPVVVSLVAAGGITAVLQNLAVTVGEDKQFQVQVFQSDGITPQPISGWALSFLVTAVNDPTVVFLTKTVGSGVSITTASLGILLVTLAAANTVSWRPGEYAYRVERTDSGSNDVVAYGYLTVLPR